jgi:alanyl-tRNA synthetase
MNTEETIRTFVDYFRDRGHQPITGTSLVTRPGDPVLFTTSGMHPLTDYLRGRPHPLGRRLVGLQRCLRTTDLDEVGDQTHLTLFEMLGTWSLGDYSGTQSLRWGYELMRDGFGVEPGRMHVTVHEGHVDALETWRSLGVPVESTTDENWWSNGPTGPCGPDSEIFIWTGESPPEGSPTTDPRWVEVWNHVFMGCHRDDDGRLTSLVQSNVDTGLGLERLLSILQGKRSVFECDLFEPWMRTVPRLWPLDDRSLRLVVDHLRASIVLIGEGIRPSNTRHGYVLRRLIRRALTTLWTVDPTRSLVDLPDEPVQHTIEHFRLPPIPDVLLDEERRFRELLRRGREVVSRHRRRGPLTEEDFRYLHDTHGLPRDLIGLLDS